MPTKRHLFIFLLGCFSIIISCDGVDLTGSEDDVNGLWELQVEGGYNYLEISPDSVIYYNFKSSEGCLTTNGFEVLQVDEGGFYTISNGSDTTIVAINLSGERIHVRDLDETQDELDRYWPSSVDIGSLGFECGSADAALGKWELDEGDGNIVYLEITADSVIITNYSSFLGCYNSDSIGILEVNGNKFTVENNDPSTIGPQEVIINRIGDTIEIIREEDGQTVREIYTQSDFEASQFQPECANEFDDTFPEHIHGVWQDENYTDDGDEVGIYFKADSIGMWDYYGDSFDQGGDCYYAVIVAELVYRDGNEYRIRFNENYIFYDGGQIESTLSITVNNEVMILGSEIEDREVEEFYSRDSRIVSDLIPKCESSSAKSSSDQETNKSEIMRKLFRIKEK